MLTWQCWPYFNWYFRRAVSRIKTKNMVFLFHFGLLLVLERRRFKHCQFRRTVHWHCEFDKNKSLAWSAAFCHSWTRGHINKFALTCPASSILRFCNFYQMVKPARMGFLFCNMQACMVLEGADSPAHIFFIKFPAGSQRDTGCLHW